MDILLDIYLPDTLEDGISQISAAEKTVTIHDVMRRRVSDKNLSVGWNALPDDFTQL